MLIPFQIIGLVITVGLQLLIFDHIGPLMPLATIYFSTLVGYLVLSRTREDWPQKKVRIREAVHSALCFFVLTFILYGGTYLFNEEWDRVLISPLVALAPALSTLILSLVAADSAALILGLPEEPSNQHKRDRWS